MTDKSLSEMTFTEVFDEERPQCASSELAMARVAGRYAAGYAYEFDRAAALEAEVARLKRGLSAMAFRVVEEACRVAQDFTGDPILTGSDAAGLAARIMREVMAKIDAGPQEDGGLIEVPGEVPMVPRAALEWLALRADVREAFRARGITDPMKVPLTTAEIIDAALKAAEEACDE